ncbi:MAG: bis(5'-nucleosyl)-tetraphosphatase (symmetrical) YqeK [Eubacteriales bacterium]|nr:bis(5'-nucleosyl)-tetraphosphatase (symmetrical) YqeK [Eubacteriales bacterium]
MNELQFDKYLNIIKEKLSLERLNHSISVSLTAANLSFYYNQDVEKSLIAGLLHDICKPLNLEECKSLGQKYNFTFDDEDIKSPQVLHGIIGAEYVKNELLIDDENIYYAIKNHTIGRPNMREIEKIIYVADYIEPLRDDDNRLKNIRLLAYTNINKCVYYITKEIIDFLKNKNLYIHSNTINTFMFYEKYK